MWKVTDVPSMTSLTPRIWHLTNSSLYFILAVAHPQCCLVYLYSILFLLVTTFKFDAFPTASRLKVLKHQRLRQIHSGTDSNYVRRR
jgi:hypothetical protein